MPLNTEQLQFVTFVIQQYGLSGSIISAQRALEDFGLPVGTYNACMASNDVKLALQERGIEFKSLGDDWTAKSLTPQQLMVANSLLDLTDTRSQKKKLQDLEVQTATYNLWLKDPIFKDYIHKRAEQLIGENKHEVDMALLDRVRAGDLKAIEYYNELTGRFVRERANSASSNIDIQSIVVALLEIISDEVHDHDTAMRLNARIRNLISTRNTAHALINPEGEAEIIRPESAPVRELPAELKELMEAGGGYE